VKSEIRTVSVLTTTKVGVTHLEKCIECTEVQFDLSQYKQTTTSNVYQQMKRLQTHFTANSSYIYLFYHLAETILMDTKTVL